jgi:kinesin family protein C1
MVGPASIGRGRQAFSMVNNRQDVTAASDFGSAEGSDCGIVEFTKEEVDALLNEKLKGKKFDLKVYSCLHGFEAWLSLNCLWVFFFEL